MYYLFLLHSSGGFGFTVIRDGWRKQHNFYEVVRSLLWKFECSFFCNFLSLKQPHQDGPAYMPVVAILSLGSPVVMDFVPHPNLESTAKTSELMDSDMSLCNKSSKYLPFSVVLMPRSLLIFKDMAYAGCYLFVFCLLLCMFHPCCSSTLKIFLSLSRLFAWHKRVWGSPLRWGKMRHANNFSAPTC